MALDQFRNLSYSLVTTAPVPADSGTSLDVVDGTLFPTVPFNASVWPGSSIATAANAEIVRVTLIVANTLTITRTQEGTAARTILVGDQIAATITALTLSTLEADRSAVSALATLADTHAGTASAAATSADAHAQAVSVIAAAASALATTADTHAGTASAAATSADAHANTASAAATSADAHAQAASVVAAAASALATTADTHAGTASAAATSADAHAAAASVVAAAASALATTADTHANTVSAQLVSVSAALTAAIQTASAAATSADGHANTVSAAANTISAQLVSVSAALTAAIQVASAAATSADGHANTVSVNLQTLSALVSAEVPWTAGFMSVVTNTQAINVSAMTLISGLAFSISATEQWQFEGMLILSVSALGAGVKFGTSVAGGLAASPRFMYAQTFQGAVNAQSAVATLGAFGLIAQSGATTILSGTSIASAGAVFPVTFHGVFKASATGNFQLVAAAIASAAASPVNILAGSYLKAFRHA